MDKDDEDEGNEPEEVEDEDDVEETEKQEDKKEEDEEGAETETEDEKEAKEGEEDEGDEEEDEKGEKDEKELIAGHPKEATGARAIIIVPDNERITSNFLTKYEITMIIAIRAEQISKNPKYFCKIDPEDDNCIKIAKKELYSHNCPLKIRRTVGYTSNGEAICEEWKVREMSLLPI